MYIRDTQDPGSSQIDCFFNFGIKDKGSIMKPSEVKASVNLNQYLFKLGEGQILMSAENHD